MTWKLVFFLPLLILTIYIIVSSVRADSAEDAYEDEQKKRLISAAEQMLKAEKIPGDLFADFIDYDFSIAEKPRAKFTLKSPQEVYPFEAKDGKLIRYRKGHKFEGDRH